MDIVLYTQRVEIVESYGERRDCADQNIARFIEACGYLSVPVPNVKEVAEQMFIQLKPRGIILTGGNDLLKYGGNAPERDETEQTLLKLSLKEEVPVYGFCRGMQVIVDYFGCSLEKVDGHVAVRHSLLGNMAGLEVNSYHNLACFHTSDSLETLAWTEDGAIEAIKVKKKNILATMWHPEREKVFRKEDIVRVQKLFL